MRKENVRIYARFDATRSDATRLEGTRYALRKTHVEAMIKSFVRSMIVSPPLNYLRSSLIFTFDVHNYRTVDFVHVKCIGRREKTSVIDATKKVHLEFKAVVKTYSPPILRIVRAK